MFATLGKVPVLTAACTLPRCGAWTADVRVDSRDAGAVTGRVTLTLGDLVLSGTVASGGVFSGAAEARIVGGAGGLGKRLAAKFYEGPTASLVLSDIAAAVGETISDTSEAALLATRLPRWSRNAGSATAALTELVRALDNAAVWRVLPNGAIWVGRDAWTVATVVDALVLDESPRERRRDVATEKPAALLPGATFRGRRVDLVSHELQPSAFLSRLYEAA